MTWLSGMKAVKAAAGVLGGAYDRGTILTESDGHEDRWMRHFEDGLA